MPVFKTDLVIGYETLDYHYNIHCNQEYNEINKNQIMMKIVPHLFKWHGRISIPDYQVHLNVR